VTAPVIDAVNDTGTVVNGFVGGTSVTNVLANDKLNGVAVVPGKVTTTFVSSTHPGLTLSGTNVAVVPGTPVGSYSLVYQICEILNPTNCDTATVTVPVTGIDAVNDTGALVNGYTGGTSVPNVLVNDTLNGVAATVATVNLTQASTTNAGVTLNPATGAVNVAPGTPAGSHTLVYQICEKLYPLNCDTATVTVPVPPPTANNDTYTGTVNMAATAYTTVLANDIGTGGTAVLNTGVSYGTLIFNADGTFTYTPALNYIGPDSFTYKATNGDLESNVATVTITVALALPSIKAVSTAVTSVGTMTFTVANGPGNALDWVGLYCPASTTTDSGGYIDWRYLNNSKTAPTTGLTGGTITFPALTGVSTCTAKLFASNGGTRLAISETVTVTEGSVKSTISATSTLVTRNTTMTFTVANGPGYVLDWVALYCPAATTTNAGYINWKYLSNSQTAPATGKTGASITFTAPNTATTCNAKLFFNDGSTKLATSATVTVK